VLHHVDLKKCLDEVKRVLKPGGQAAFWDPVAHNPVINVYRRMAMPVRTHDEHPLRRSDIKFFRSRFSEFDSRFFWLTSLVVFLKFYLWDRVHPSTDRYWKRILAQERDLRPLVNPLMSLDRTLLRLIPGLGWWCWNVVVVVRK
jgi:SAM-dependent methyltransferase